MKTKNLHIIQSVGANLGRLIVGSVFIFSGFVKAVDPLGFQYKLQDYFEAFGVGSWFPPIIPLLIAIAVAVVEFSIGVSMFLGIRKSLVTFLALLLMAFMTPLTLVIAIMNPVSDCGCFGDAWVITNWQTFGKNVVLLAFAYMAFKWRKTIVPFISAKTDWLVSMYTVLFVLILSCYCLYYLPIIDFRPYKIGASIRDGMEIPEGAKLPVYESTFILEKDGKKQEFTLENYPDNSWTFVDARTVLKEKGYEPPIHDFSLKLHETGEDITEHFLDNKGYTFLLVARRLDNADDSNIDLINEIYDYSVEHGYEFYCLTSSTDDSIDEWRDKSGAEYPFVLVDDVTLKTMIRANPGLMLIQDGTILNKWSDTELPDEYVLRDEPLNQLEIGVQKQVSLGKTLFKLSLWYIIPLLIILGLDLLLVRRREIQFHLLHKRNKDMLQSDESKIDDNT